MPYSKLKNLMILLLALVNVILLCLVIPLRGEWLKQRRLEVESLETLFQSCGVQLDASRLPEDRELYTLEFSPDPDAALPAVKALLGENVLVRDDSTRYLSLYTSERGRCQLSRGGNLDARLTGWKAASSFEGETRELLEGMGLSLASLSQPVRRSAGVYTVAALQSLLDAPVFSSELTCTFRAGALIRLEGTAYLDTAGLCRTDDTACVSCAGALVAFLGSRDELGWVGASVETVEQGYMRAGTASAAVVRLVPGWRVATDTGAFWVNGVTCEVSPFEE